MVGWLVDPRWTTPTLNFDALKFKSIESVLKMPCICQSETGVETFLGSSTEGTVILTGTLLQSHVSSLQVQE